MAQLCGPAARAWRARRGDVCVLPHPSASMHGAASALRDAASILLDAASGLHGQQGTLMRGAGHAELHGTTVLCVRKGDQVVMVADGQITAGAKVVKPNARKLRRLGAAMLGGFAGSTADGVTLFERLEVKLEEHPGQLRRAAVELAKAWRQDRVLRHLQASMIVADATTCLEVSGAGEVLEPADGVHAIGSGSRFAIAAARALMDQPALDARAIAQCAMEVAAQRCIYTNNMFVWEVISDQEAEQPAA